MQRSLSPAVLAAVTILVGLSAFGVDTGISPAPLQAQECGNHSGKLCEENCFRECSNGSCCGWTYTYYPKVVEQT